MEVKDLSPQVVWRNFYSLTQIPRPSGHTAKVAQFLVEFAQGHGAEAYIDEGGNVVMKKAATAGMEVPIKKIKISMKTSQARTASAGVIEKFSS